jgi:dolichol-phosphate mannosyltransferase
MSSSVASHSASGPAAGHLRHSGAPSISVVIPTRNEEGNIDPLVERLDGVLASTAAEIIFVDDSDDGTLTAIEGAQALCRHEVRAIHRPPGSRQGGLGGAVVEGMRSARAPWICVMPPDQPPPPQVSAGLAASARQ